MDKSVRSVAKFIPIVEKNKIWVMNCKKREPIFVVGGSVKNDFTNNLFLRVQSGKR